MNIIHISDLHFPVKIPIFSLRGKMFSGYINYMLRRKKKHPAKIFQALIEKIKQINYDLLIISGDIGNVSHPVEFTRGRKILAPILDSRTFIVPGNHDRYMDSAIRPVDLFEKEFEDYMGESINHDLYLKIKKVKDITVIGWDSNEPTGVGNAMGRVQPSVVSATKEYLEKEKPLHFIITCHHPIWSPAGVHESIYHKMKDRELVLDFLKSYPPIAYLHGHKHTNWHKLPSENMNYSIINSASSTRLCDPGYDSGFHLVECENKKLNVKRYAYNLEKQSFEEVEPVKYNE